VESESDENAAGDPASEARAWGTPSLFTQVTMVPVFTVSEEGSNAKFLIATVAPPPGVAGGAAGAVVWLDEQPAAIQARMIRTVPTMQNIWRDLSGIIP